ncbi:hypothetical protein QC761_600168 [Podospora bellae-mahoneyi]|uniref:Uncharacterized protein n=1 Tax=Podospora bellae-mahoneyi TaxID=2093777 RepID=A0ABR0FCA8_9PEZI|nr:hypothetical protein QC761_600168 [Podospora bellae-mahoneyi]
MQPALKNNIYHHVLENFGDLFDLFRILRNSSGVTKSDIAQQDRHDFPHGHNIWPHAYGSCSVLEWRGKVALRGMEIRQLYEAVMAIISPLTPQDRYFIKLGNAHSLDTPQQNPSIAIERMAKYLGILEKPSSESQPGQRHARTPFHPQHIMRLTSFHIVWTNDILEHLVVKVSKKSKPLSYVFHDATVLRQMWLYAAGGQHPYRELAEETLKTLGLLMPVEDLDTASCEMGVVVLIGRNTDAHFTSQMKKASTTLSTPQQTPPSRATRYTYNRASPQTILGFWRDRQNLREWWTFWIALLRLVLVLIGFLVATDSLAVGVGSVLEAKEANRYASIESVENEKAASSESSAGCCCLATTLDTSVSFDVLGTSNEGLAVVQPTDIFTSLETRVANEATGPASATITSPPPGQMSFFSAGRPRDSSTT